MHETKGEPTKPSKGRGLLVALLTVPVLMAVGIGVLGYLSSRPPDGPPLAVLDIRSGEPFEHTIVSKGGSLQVWLDAECDDCSYPIEGSLQLVSNGRTLESVEISAGSTKRGGWDGGKKSLATRGVLDAQAPPPGTTMTLSGVLTVHGARDALMHRVRNDAPAPRVELLRLTVTE